MKRLTLTAQPHGWSATPSGQLTFNTVNKAAVESLELGGEYYLDITPAPAKE